MSFRQDFIAFAVVNNILRFGEFKTKAGRLSPYFFNAGLFNDGHLLSNLADFYTAAIKASDIRFDMLFGPAYKGIPLVTAIAIKLAQQNINYPFAFNRKEAKDHGEGGYIIGSPLKGRVLIVDDVISAGTSVRESVELIKEAGAQPAGVLIALDRQERGQTALSAVEEVQQNFGIPVIPVATLGDLMAYINTHSEFSVFREAITRYRQQYGTAHA